jgi:hypothetical protein
VSTSFELPTLRNRPHGFDLSDEVYAELADAGTNVVFTRVKEESGVSWNVIAKRIGLSTGNYCGNIFRGTPDKKRAIRQTHVEGFIAAIRANWRLECFLWLKWGRVPNHFMIDVLVLDLMVTLGHPMIDSRERNAVRSRVAAVLRPWMQALHIEHYDSTPFDYG